MRSPASVVPGGDIAELTGAGFWLASVESPDDGVDILCLDGGDVVDPAVFEGAAAQTARLAAAGFEPATKGL